jgi:hypothetical protein
LCQLAQPIKHQAFQTPACRLSCKLLQRIHTHSSLVQLELLQLLQAAKCCKASVCELTGKQVKSCSSSKKQQGKLSGACKMYKQPK